MFHILKPLYLIGLSLGAIPLILHLLGRRRIHEQPFSSLFLLKEIKKSSSVWLRVKDLILLILRTLFIIFAVFAFVQPLILSPVPFLGKSAPRDIAILVDTSMSMGMQGVLGRTREKLRKLVKELAGDNRLMLIAFSDRIERSQEVLAETEALDFVENLEVSSRSTEILPALKHAEKVLSSQEGFIKDIIIVSDFQKSGFQNAGTVASSLAKNGITPYAVFIPASDHNFHFSDWSMEPPFPLQGMRVKLYPKLASSPAIPHSVELFIKGTMRGSKKITPEAELSFEMELESSGYQWGHFRINGDSLSLDNDHYFSFHVPEFLNILLVGTGNEYAYVAAALQPGIKTPIKLTTILPSELVKSDPQQYDLLILYNITLAGAAKARILDYLSNGGALLYVIGDAGLKQKDKLLDSITIEKKNRSEEGFFAIKSADAGFPPFSDFKKKGIVNLSEVRIYQYFTLSSSMNPIIVAKNGDPFALSGTIRNGRVVVFAFAFDTDWSQLPLKAIFVPLLYRIAFFLSAKQEQVPHYTVGDALRMSSKERLSNPTFILPDGNEKSATETEDGYVLRNTDTPGIYTFVPNPEESIPIAVNVDRLESNLEKLSPDELKVLMPGIQLSEGMPFSASGNRWLNLFPFFLVLAILCLAAELILQNR